MAATKRVVDLSDVKEGGNFRTKRVKAGDYRAKIVKADDHQPKDSSKPMGWVLTIQLEGHARSSYPYYLSPESKQAFKVRNICVAAGLKVPKGRLNFDPNRLVGKAIGVEMEDDEYDGRPKSSIGEVFPVSEVGANADEDDAPDEIEEDEVDTEEVPDDEAIEEDDEEEEEEPEPTPPPKRRVKKAAPAPDRFADVAAEEEDDEEDEEPAPPPRRRKAAAPPAKKAARPKPAPEPEDEDDDLDDLDTDDLDD